jgi:antitoxin ChpS
LTLEAIVTTATLRPVGGSTVVAIPPALLVQLGLSARSVVTLRVENGALVIEPARARPTLDDLLAQCDLSAPFNTDEQASIVAKAAWEWTRSPTLAIHVS